MGHRAFTSRVLAGLATVVAVVGLSLAVAGPAAADTGVWRAYGNKNPITSSWSTWTCAPSVRIETNVAAQVCVVRSVSGASVQAAVIVRDNQAGLFATNARASLFNQADAVLYAADCPRSGVAADSWSVCFGETIAHGNSVHAGGLANGRSLGVVYD